MPLSNIFEYQPRNKKLGFTQLRFANDLLLFNKASLESKKILFAAFNKFSKAFWLESNPNKSCIYFLGTSKEVKRDILTEFSMSKGELPFRYLGCLYI